LEKLLVLSKIKNGSFSLIPDTGVFLLEEANSASGSSLAAEGDLVVG
jgi:hypothetical protein